MRKLLSWLKAKVKVKDWGASVSETCHYRSYQKDEVRVEEINGDVFVTLRHP